MIKLIVNVLHYPDELDALPTCERASLAHYSGQTSRAAHEPQQRTSGAMVIVKNTRSFLVQLRACCSN